MKTVHPSPPRPDLSARPSRKTLPGHLTPIVLLAGLALALGTTLRAQAQALGGPDFRLATDSAGLDVRDFMQSDTLHMWVRSPAARKIPNAPAPPSLTGWWRLDGLGESFSGPLVPRGDGLVAALPLSELTQDSQVWIWSASVEWKGRTLATPIAALQVEMLAPQAGFSASTQEGEMPLVVQFEDHSEGDITSWYWDFGDGQSSNEPNPTHVYTAPGEFVVRLAVANPWGQDEETAPNANLVQDKDFQIDYGMNASENVWWERGIAFSDAMARAGEFFRVINGEIGRIPAPLIPFGIPPGRLLPLPGAGWPDLAALEPGEKAGTRLFGSMNGSMPDGRVQPYVLTWRGTGSCKLDGPSVVAEANRTSNRAEVFIDPFSGDGDSLLIWLIDSSDPADPVRNAHVWLPGMEEEQPILWPPFAEKLQAMNGGCGPRAWRAMDWNQVNQYGRTTGSAPFLFDLDGLIMPWSPSQGTKRGVCPEFQAALCNAVGTNLHLNVPHAADGMSDADYDFFLRDLFTRIRDGSPAVRELNGGRPFDPLAPHLKLIVEFSNEIWNPGFPVNAWLKAQAQASGRTFHQQIAHEIERVFAVAEEVFSGPDAERLQRFVGGWLGDASFLLEVLGALDSSVHIDAVGPAAYFGPRRVDIDAWMADAVPGSCPNCPTPEAVIESARQRIADLDLRLLEHQLVSSSRVNPDGSLPRYELYEGGSSFAAGFQPWGVAASEAQRLPAMYETYVFDFIPALIARGIETVNWYSFLSDGNAQGSSGPFGHWERMDQIITLPVPEVYVDEGAPKAAAIYRLPPLR